MTEPEWGTSRPKLERDGLELTHDGPLGEERPRPDVQAQLAQRRQKTLAPWRRDAFREVALLVVLAALLVVLYVVTVAAKDRQFRGAAEDESGTFWMESAQRFRYVEMVADGGFIPVLDRQMQAPDGYPPWSDTVLQEVFYGDLYRRFAPAGADLSAFVRLVTRLTAATTVFPLVLLVFALTSRRDAALLAALAYGTCLAVTERGTGAGILREDLAVPVLCWHLAFLALWARRPRLPTALVSGLLLALALLLWKVVHFYVLMVVVLLGTAHWLNRDRATVLLSSGFALVGPCVLAALLPLSLRHDGFLTSTPLLAAAAVGMGLVGNVLFRKAPLPFWLGLALAVFVGLRLALPGEAGYDHAWETIQARLRFGFTKPTDPSLLSFHARHYWTGNYESPTAALLARNWPALLLAALPGLIVMVRGWSRRRFESQVATLSSSEPTPTRLWDGLGPADPLAPLASHFLLWLVLSFTGAYLVFRKLQLLGALALAVAVGVGFAGVRRGRPRVRGAILALVLVSAAQGWGVLPTLDRVLQGDAEPSWNPVEVFPAGAFDSLVRHLSDETQPGDTVLASFVVSPFILAYTPRPTVLHCFFEGTLLDRFAEVVEARFQPEDVLWELSRRTGAVWYVHEAHHLLRTDPRMSQRYVADRLDWPRHSVLARMQYAPEELDHFELRYENDWFRVFRVLAPDEQPAAPPASPPRVMWSRSLFTHLFGDPLSSSGLSPRDDGVQPEDLLYATLQAEQWLQRAQSLAPTEGVVSMSWSERYLQEALRIAPYLYSADEALADFYTRLGRTDRTEVHLLRAEATRKGLSGDMSFGSQVAPQSPLKR